MLSYSPLAEIEGAIDRMCGVGQVDPPRSPPPILTRSHLSLTPFPFLD
jgi:hypothetical protein